MTFAERFIWYLFIVFFFALLFLNPTSFLGKYDDKAGGNKIHCVENTIEYSSSNLSPSITDCTNGAERRDLDFSSIIINAPKLAERVWLARDRIRDLRKEHRRNRKWMQTAIKRINFFILVAALAVILLPNWRNEEGNTSNSNGNEANSIFSAFSQYISGLFTHSNALKGLLALLVIGLTSFSYSSKYSAIYAAERNLRGLESRIDTESALMFFDYHNKQGKYGEKDWQKVDEAVLGWVAKLEEIEKKFGEQFSKTYQTITLPDFL